MFIKARHDKTEERLKKYTDGKRVLWSEIIGNKSTRNRTRNIKQKNDDIPTE
jgi:hypothetical protein